MSGREIYDASQKLQRLVKEKAARREVLRQQFQKEIQNPYRHALAEGGTVFDSGVQRYLSWQATGVEYFKPTLKNGLAYVGLVVMPIVLFTLLLKKSRDDTENLYRTGQVSYIDRRFKFH